MKTRTKTLTICLSLALALSACGEQESAESYLIQAQSFSKESQYKESVVALKNAARLAPDDSEIRFLGEYLSASGPPNRYDINALNP